MCGRFTLTVDDVAALARAWAAEVDAAVAAAWRPRYNVAPGDPHLLLRNGAPGRRLERARFGIAGARGRLHLNARIETAPALPAFREAWRERRCAVPADGFFEWEGPEGARRPVWFHRPSGRPLLLAGLFEEREGALAFAILTTGAAGPVRPIHDRMPVLLPEEGLGAWLAGTGPAPATDAELIGRPVSPRVNSVEHDDPACLEPPAPERQLKLL
ncbi:MAG TPA: SOS response-associated peptidase [Anaeromyxobacteraceae bacterium]|nr:SOS response-associated peptidase [Anaeromyxobacteraceae bacterium]